MSKPWLKNYPKDVSHEIDLLGYNSLIDFFHQSVEKYQDQPAFNNFDTELSFNEVDKLSRDFAAYLQTNHNLEKGDRVALMSPNTLSFPVAMWGIIRTGAVQVNVNPMYTARELAHQLNDAQVDTIIIFSGSTPVLAEIIEKTSIQNIITIDLDDLVNKGLPAIPIDERLTLTNTFSQALNIGRDLALTEPSLSTSDLIFLQYTGGTTGLSKGAMLTHGNIMSNTLQCKEFLNSYTKQGEEVVLTAIPMYHIFALTVNALCYFFYGAKNILVTNPRDMPAFVKIWQTHDITFFTGVNTLFNGLLHTPGFSEVDFSKLKLCIGGGASVQEAVATKWLETTGTRLNEGYGLSETSPVLTLNIGDVNCTISGIGVPVSSTDISIHNDSGIELPQGEAGELWAKGPQVMAGYWNNVNATKESITEDGYFKTGDIAMIDMQGFAHIVDRKKDMINVSGFKVFPNEIEAEVAKIPGIVESACIGVEDDRTGEAVKLFVVRENETLTEQDIINFCRKSLTGYKIPKYVHFIEQIPKSTVGKILRRELK